MQCEYAKTCKLVKKECIQNKRGWDVEINRCVEKKVKDRVTNKTIIEIDSECTYKEPVEPEFDSQFYFDLEDFRGFEFVGNAHLNDDDEKLAKINEKLKSYQYSADGIEEHFERYRSRGYS